MEGIMLEGFQVLLILVAGHLICDYPLQGDAIAIGKNRNIDPARFGVNWYYWMASHAATHAMAVGLITHSFVAGLFEFWMHFIIDFGKCEKKYGLHVDQALHVICKIAIVLIVKNYV